jgi:hypothetical protein
MAISFINTTLSNLEYNSEPSAHGGCEKSEVRVRPDAGSPRSFIRPTISRLRRVISPNPPLLRASPPHNPDSSSWASQRAPRAVPRVLSLRHDAFEPHLAGMGEDGRAVAFDMLVEPDTGASLGHDRCERGLADLKRITSQVVAIQLDQVEGI